MAGYFFISINAVTYNFHCNMHCVTVKNQCYTRSIIMLVRQRESWIKQWESGDVPTLAQLGVNVSDDLRQQWRDNWRSEGWRMAKGMEMLCSWLEWRDKKPA